MAMTVQTKTLEIIEQTQTMTAEELLRMPSVLGADDTIDGGDVVPGWTMAVRDVFA